MVENKIDFSKIYSFSKLKRFEKCPLDYYFYYLDPKWKGYKKPRDYRTKGQAVHGAITLFYYLPEKKRNFENLKECLKKSWFSEADLTKKPPLGELGGFKDIDHERRTYFEALKLLKNFYELGEITPPIFYLPTIEIKDSFPDYEDLIKPINEEFSISGKFDRIDKLEDGSLRIIDYKTGNENQDNFQLIFYKLLAELNFNQKVKIVSFYYLDRKKISDFNISNVTQEEIKNKILEKIKTIENTKEFKPRISKLCKHCDFFPICPGVKKIKI